MDKRPPIPDPPYQGGCLCGQVRWRLDARPLAINGCHCDDCKKLSGATHILMLLASSDALSSTGETQSYRKRAASGREVDIFRCVHCGTRLWHRNLSAPALVFIAAGTLDDASWVVPASHIWVERAAPSVVMEEDALKLQGQPDNREVLIDAFSAIYSVAPSSE